MMQLEQTACHIVATQNIFSDLKDINNAQISFKRCYD